MRSRVGFHGVLSQALSDREQTQATSEGDNIAMATGLGGLDSRLVRLGAWGQMPLIAQETRQWLKPQQQNLNSFLKAKSSAIFGKIH